MKILWHSNAPWAHTGYGNQTNLFWWRIQKLGHEVALSACWGLGGAALNVESHGETTRVLPGGYTVHGNDIIAPHAEYTKADIVITLYDAWVYEAKVTSRFRWCPWLPVDHEPIVPAVKQVLQTAWQPIAYSKFGERMMKDAGLDPIYIPHGVDTKAFAPKPREDARKALNLDKSLRRPMEEIDFLAVMVAANKGLPSRKSFPEVLWAWREFVKRHEGAVLYLHTHAGRQMNGVELHALLEALDMPQGAVIFCDSYWNVLGYPDSYMNNVYNAADVLLNPAQGEGFGLPIVEAQACGTPVIVNDCTSMTELCFSGWMTKGQPFYTPQRAWQSIPNIADILDRLERAYESKGDEQMRSKARAGAMAYDADLVTEKYWKPALEQIAEEIEVGDVSETVKL